MKLRLLLVMVGVVAVVLIVHDVPLANHLERVERDRLTTSLERDAFILGGRAEEALEAATVGDDPELESIVARLSDEEGVRVAIVDSDLVGVLGSDASVIGEDFSNRPEIARASSGVPDTGERFSRTLGEDLFFVAVPVLSGRDVVGVVRLSAPERVVSDRVAGKVRGLAVVAGISLLIAVAVAWHFARTITRPLEELERTTHELASGDLAARADTGHGPPEVRSLATSFNSMASRLQGSVDRQARFAGDASHQLRTPLTALRLRLEQAAAAVDDGSPAREPIDGALNETERLRRLIEGLLVLSRVEHVPEDVMVNVDLVEVVADRAEYWRPLAAERGVAVEVDAPGLVRATVVIDSVEQIVDNLVDNALEVAPTGSTLRLAVAELDDGVELHVIDDGPGLSDESRERAFERFWRDAGAESGGSGLGLAIVHELATAAGGSAVLRSSATGGIDAVVRFRSP